MIFFVFMMLFINTASAQTDGYPAGNNSINSLSINQSYDIRVVLDHILISKKNNSLEISEIVVFRNEGPEIFYTEENHTYFGISIPEGAANLKTEVMECCLVEQEGMVFMDPMQSIKNGENFEMQISYTLHPHEREYILNKSIIYNTSSLLILAEKKGEITFEGASESITLKGNNYGIIAFDNLEPGGYVRLPLMLSRNQELPYGIIALALVLMICVIYLLKEKITRKKKEYTLSELELEKKKLFEAMRNFEKNSEGRISDEYSRLMDEYRQKAIQVIIKIDKMKNE